MDLWLEMLGTHKKNKTELVGSRLISRYRDLVGTLVMWNL